MVNSDSFSKRLKKIFDYYELSASSFADKIDVGRASISHILSGRNKPSLDFVMKVVSTFDEVDLYWLLNGKGNFPSSTPVEEDFEKNKAVSRQEEPKEKIETKETVNKEGSQTKIKDRKIDKVIIFYSDGSFESFENYPKS